MTEEPAYILPAEYVGEARHDDDGWLTIGLPDDKGEGVVRLQLTKPGLVGWWNTGSVGVYVRRVSDDLSIVEIAIARHDGLAQEELDAENDEAQRYPLGPKEYWRTKSVGHYTYGEDGHLMTDDEFEQDWHDG